MTVAITQVSGNELYFKYFNQINPQDCYVELDCEREELTATYNSEIGNAIPASVFNGHDQRFSIPCLNESSANALLEEILPLAERVVAGYESGRNGNNHVAKFSEDAKKAIEEIEYLCTQDNFDCESMVIIDEENEE